MPAVFTPMTGENGAPVPTALWNLTASLVPSSLTTLSKVRLRWPCHPP